MPVIEEMKVIVTVDSDQGEVGLKKFSKQIDLTASKATALNFIVQGFRFSAMIAAAGQATSGIQALGAAAFSTASALGPLSGLVTTLPAGFLALAGAGGAVITSIKGVGDAVKASSKAQDAAIVTTADQKAGLAEMAAQAKASEQAIKNIASAEKSLVVAQENVVKAQQRLNEALKPADYITAKEAELSLRAARLEQADALADLTKLTDRYNTGLQKVSKVVTGIKDDFTGKTLEFVTEVKGEDPAEVMRQQEAARLRVEQATLNILRAEERINDVRKIGTEEDERVIAAREALAAAVESVRDAQEGLAEAQKDYNDLSKNNGEVAASMADFAKATEAADEAMAKLSPSAQKFVGQIIALKPAWKEIQQGSQEEMFSRLSVALDEVVKILPKVDYLMSAFAGTVGDVAVEAGQLVGSEGFGSRFLTAMENSRGLLAKGGDAAVRFADGMSYILVAAKPVTDWLGDSIKLWGMQFQAYAKAGEESGKLNSFFERTADVADDVVSIFGDLYGALKNLGAAAAPLGDDLLNSLVEGADAWREWTENADNAVKVTAWFDSFRPVLREAGGLIKDIALAFLKFDAKSGLITTMQVFRDQMLPLIAEFTQHVSNDFGPKLIEFIAQAVRLWMDMWDAAGGIYVLLPAFTELAKVAAWFVESVPGVKQIVMALGTLHLFKKFDSILGLSKAISGISASSAGLAGTTEAVKEAGTASETAGQQAVKASGGFSGMVKSLANVQSVAFLGIAAFQMLVDIQKKAEQQAKELGDTLSKEFKVDDATTFNNFVAKQNELIKQHNGLVDEANANRYNPFDAELAGQYADASNATGGLINENTKLIDTVNQLAEVYGGSKQPIYEWVQAQKEAGNNLEDQAALLKEYGKTLEETANESMGDLLDSTWNMVDANLAARESVNTTAGAITDYNTKVASGTASLDELSGALNRAERAAYDQAKQAADTAEAQAKLEGKTLSAKDASEIQRQKLEEIVSQLDPNSPLRQNIQGTIDKLSMFEQTYQAELTVKTAEAKANLLATLALIYKTNAEAGRTGKEISAREFNDLMAISQSINWNELTAEQQLALNIFAILKGLNASVDYRAAGGPIQAGKPYIVGENGPEMIVPPANGYVVPNSGGAGVAPIGNGQTGGITSSDVDRLVDALKEARPINLNYTSEESVTAREMAHDIAWNL